MEKILIEVIITNQCNKRCNYCDLNFSNKVISDNNIILLSDFINLYKKNYFHINFFWGEPLLEFDKIKNIINKIKSKNIKYSIWTNWTLLNNKILDFFYKNKVFINLSVDNITWFKNISNIEKKYFDIIEINFINDPDFLFKSKKIFLEIINKWFQKINFMPVFTTKKWINTQIINLWKIIKEIKNFDNKVDINYFYYFNWISLEKQFILDTDWFFYNDLDSLLWLQKQYSIIYKTLWKKINFLTKNISLNDKNFCLEKLLDRYNIIEILKLIIEIPKKQWCEKNNIILKRVLENAK